MAITINGSGTITGISAGGLPDGSVTADDIASLPSGSVLQVVQGELTSAEAIVGTGNWADFGSLTATITPSSTSSKIEVTVAINLGTTSNTYAHAKVRRGTTDIGIGDSVGSRNRASFSISGDSHEFTKPDTRTFVYLDSPSTTSATTYKLRIKVNSSQTIKINCSGEDEDSNNTGARYVSTITLREIAG